MIDRDRLRLALDWWDSDFNVQDDGHGVERIVEAARLVADPATLTISKVDGEWPYWVGEIRSATLDALLEGQHDPR